MKYLLIGLGIAIVVIVLVVILLRKNSPETQLMKNATNMLAKHDEYVDKLREERNAKRTEVDNAHGTGLAAISNRLLDRLRGSKRKP